VYERGEERRKKVVACVCVCVVWLCFLSNMRVGTVIMCSAPMANEAKGWTGGKLVLGRLL
jgi:hypothetical protein